MTPTASLFKFADRADAVTSAHDFIIRVPTGIRSQAELFDSFSKGGQFPAYFGRNWDAFSDCLRDFNWIQTRRIAITHRDLPLWNKPVDCATYLNILRLTVADWAEEIKSPADPSQSETGYVTHELVVAFPSGLREAVEKILARDA